MITALLDGSDAARVRAFDDVDQPLGLLGVFFLRHPAVPDKGDGDFRVDIGENVKAHLADIALDLYYVLFSVFLAADVLQKCHAGIVQLFQLHHVVERQTRACGNVVNDHAVLDFINLQH